VSQSFLFLPLPPCFPPTVFCSLDDFFEPLHHPWSGRSLRFFRWPVPPFALTLNFCTFSHPPRACHRLNGIPFFQALPHPAFLISTSFPSGVFYGGCFFVPVSPTLPFIFAHSPPFRDAAFSDFQVFSRSGPPCTRDCCVFFVRPERTPLTSTRTTRCSLPCFQNRPCLPFVKLIFVLFVPPDHPFGVWSQIPPFFGRARSGLFNVPQFTYSRPPPAPTLLQNKGPTPPGFLLLTLWHEKVFQVLFFLSDIALSILCWFFFCFELFGSPKDCPPFFSFFPFHSWPFSFLFVR